jgi:beta-lactam-binding protein with PASTA domain
VVWWLLVSLGVGTAAGLTIDAAQSAAIPAGVEIAAPRCEPVDGACDSGPGGLHASAAPVSAPAGPLRLAAAVRLQPAPDSPEGVPDVVGDSLEVAVERLAARDFIARVANGPAEDPRARVTGQDPPGGARPPRDRLVRLWLGVEGARRLVPDVIGEPVAAAVERLAASGLEAEITSPGRLPGNARVIRQSPSGGSIITNERRVRLWLGFEEAGVEVPPVEGRSAAEAEDIIGRFGLRPVFTDGEVPGDAIVVRQRPEAGSLASPGSAVQLEVRVPGVEVPPVTGMALADAVRTLRRHELQAEVEGGVSERDAPVIFQEPEAGARVPAGSSVFLRTRSTAAQVLVPGVIGRERDAALEAIEAAGLAPRVSGTQGTRNSRVIRQQPPAGAQARPGATVNLWLSPPTERPGGDEDRPDRGAGGDRPGGPSDDDQPGEDAGGSSGGIDRDLLIPLTIGLGGLALGVFVMRRIRGRRKPKPRDAHLDQVTFDPHPGTPDAHADDRFGVRVEIRLEPVADARGEQTLNTPGPLVSNWEELP